MNKQICFLFGVFFFLFSCKKEKEIVTPEPANDRLVRLLIQPKFGSQNLFLDTEYELNNGIKIKISDIKVYFTNIKINNSLLKDVVLFDYRNSGNLIFTVACPEVDKGSIQFNLGVPASINHNDPSAFHPTNPLNILIANDMHWAWNTGYVFYKIEGKADTIVDANSFFNVNLSYHVGMDANYSSKTISGLNWTAITDLLDATTLKIDIKKFFENNTSPIHVPSEYQTHSMPGEEAITNKVKTNFSASISAL